MTMKTYAVKHKLSLFNVVKMIKSGQLKSETVEENGKEVTYILGQNRLSRSESKNSTSEISMSNKELQTLVLSLQEEVVRLRHEMDSLKMSIGLTK